MNFGEWRANDDLAVFKIIYAYKGPPGQFHSRQGCLNKRSGRGSLSLLLSRNAFKPRYIHD